MRRILLAAAITLTCTPTLAQRTLPNTNDLLVADTACTAFSDMAMTAFKMRDQGLSKAAAKNEFKKSGAEELDSFVDTAYDQRSDRITAKVAQLHHYKNCMKTIIEGQRQ